MNKRILTLDEILAQPNTHTTATPPQSAIHTTTPVDNNDLDSNNANISLAAAALPTKPVSKKTPKRPTTPITHNSLLTTIKQDSSPTQAQILTALANTPTEPLYTTDQRTQYLRWLAFYYLSKRELSRHELSQKLLNKAFSLDEIEPLLDEFASKDYQNELRYAQMVIREAIRKNRGKQHIAHTFQHAKLNLPYSLDELLEMTEASALDNTILQDSNTQEDSKQNDNKINWLLLAVEARVKKYGDTIPVTPKDKAKQLRFLQYRGFAFDVCMDALKMRLEDVI